MGFPGACSELDAAVIFFPWPGPQMRWRPERGGRPGRPGDGRSIRLADRGGARGDSSLRLLTFIDLRWVIVACSSEIEVPSCPLPTHHHPPPAPGRRRRSGEKVDTPAGSDALRFRGEDLLGMRGIWLWPPLGTRYGDPAQRCAARSQHAKWRTARIGYCPVPKVCAMQAGGTGRPKRNPWTMSHPRARTASSSPVVSTPSATTSSPKSWASRTTASMIRVSP